MKKQKHQLSDHRIILKMAIFTNDSFRNKHWSTQIVISVIKYIKNVSFLTVQLTNFMQNI